MTIKKNKLPSNLEKDATKQEVARFIVEASQITEIYEIPDAVVDLAGPKAIANQFTFDMQDSGDEVYISAQPIKLAEGQYYEREGLISYALPKGCSSLAEMTWSFGEGVSVEEAAVKLYKAGFQFDAKHQDGVEKKFTSRIKAALSAEFNKKSEPKKKKPAPKKKNDNNGNDTYGGGFGRGGFGRGGCWGTGRGGMGW